MCLQWVTHVLLQGFLKQTGWRFILLSTYLVKRHEEARLPHRFVSQGDAYVSGEVNEARDRVVS